MRIAPTGWRALLPVAPDGGIHVIGVTASTDFPVVDGLGNPEPEDLPHDQGRRSCGDGGPVAGVQAGL